MMQPTSSPGPALMSPTTIVDPISPSLSKRPMSQLEVLQMSIVRLPRQVTFLVTWLSARYLRMSTGFLKRLRILKRPVRSRR